MSGLPAKAVPHFARGRAIAALAAAWSITAPAAAQDALTFPVLTRAQQPFTCADLNDAEGDAAESIRQWAIGFWSGMNVGERTGTGARVGRRTTAAGAYGEIRLFCRQHPATPVDQAVYTVRERMKALGG